MTQKHSRLIQLLAAALLCLPIACDSLGDIAAFFGSGVTIVIENNTAFTAVPDLRTSDSRNLVEDLFVEDDQLTNFGSNGAILPNQTATIRLPCDGDLELIVFDGAEFREGSGIPLGEIDADTKLRRDDDFDCGDVVHVRLDGTFLDFSADVDVERSSRNRSDEDDDGDDDDLADFLDDLFD